MATVYTHRAGDATHNFVSDVVPHISVERDFPLALSADHPLQVGVGGARLAVDPSVLQLREVALEEADLVLIGRGGNVGSRALDREVVVDVSFVDGGCSLGDQFGPPHVRVPFCGAVDGDLSALL